MSSRNAAEALELVRSYFAERAAFKLVLVYGSTARGRLTDASDVDIAVAGEGQLDRKLVFTTQMELSGLLDRPVDLIDLHRVDGLILREAVIGGVKIKVDRSLFVKFHTKALIYREDFLPLQRAMRNARIARFIDGSGCHTS